MNAGVFPGILFLIIIRDKKILPGVLRGNRVVDRAKRDPLAIVLRIARITQEDLVSLGIVVPEVDIMPRCILPVGIVLFTGDQDDRRETVLLCFLERFILPVFFTIVTCGPEMVSFCPWPFHHCTGEPVLGE